MDNIYLHIERFEHPSGMEIHSFKTVLIGEWLVRVSVSNIESVVLVMIKPKNPSRCIVRVFSDELCANEFLNSVLDS